MTNFKYTFLAVFFPLISFAQNTISGDIVMPNALPVCNVLVELLDQNDQVIRQDFSEEDGTFQLLNVPNGSDYTLRFFKDDPYLNGTSTFDMVLIARTVLGIDPPAPYSLWAGDVNGTGTLTTLDMVLIRKLILNIDTSFPLPSWGFDEADALNCDSLIEIPSLTESVNVSVIGVKRGDLNNSNLMNCQ